MDESSSCTPAGSVREMNFPSPTLISKFADSLPLRFLVTVATTDPVSVVSKGDPFAELTTNNWKVAMKLGSQIRN